MAAPTTIQLPQGFTLKQGEGGNLIVVAETAQQPAPEPEPQKPRMRAIVGLMPEEKKPTAAVVVVAENQGSTPGTVAVKLVTEPVFTAKSIMEPAPEEILKVTSSKEGEFDYTFTVFHLDMQGQVKDGRMVFDNEAIDKFNQGQTWLYYIERRMSYKLPFAWPLLTFTEAPCHVDVLFPLSKLNTRMGDVMDTKISALIRTVSLQELAAIDKNIDATRTDAHMLIYDATLKGYSTAGIDVPLNTTLYSWLASANHPQGVLRPLMHRVGRKLLIPSADGKPLDAQCVMLPNQSTVFTKGTDDVHAERYHSRLYEMPDGVCDDPWISRGLQVSFDELRASLDKPISEGGYMGSFPGFLKVKAPPVLPREAPGVEHVAAVMQNISMVVWLVLNAFEFVLQESEKDLEALPTDHKLKGATVVQYNQTAAEYFFCVSKRAILELIGEWERRVQQAHVFSNCNLLALAARPLDHKAASDSYALRREIMDRERDNIDANPFVTCWATVRIRYWPFRGDPIVTPNISKYSEDDRRHMIVAIPSMSGIGAKLAGDSGVNR